MYWLGTSRWCPGPLCMLHFIWICFFLAFTPFPLPLRCLVLLYILVGVYPLWCEGCVGFWAHFFSISFLPGLGIAQVRAFIFIACKAHVFFFMAVGLLAINPVVLLHCVCYNFVFPFTSYYPVGLRADVPAVSAHCFINHWLRASLAHLPHIYLLWAYWPSFLPCQPVLPLYPLGFLSPFTSSLPPFTLMGLLLNSLGLPSFFYSIFTSYYSYELIDHYSCHVNPLSLLIYS